MTTLLTAALAAAPAFAADPFTPANPFYAPSALPFQAPAVDKIKDCDYQPAIEAGMAQQRAEIDTIAAITAARSTAWPPWNWRSSRQTTTAKSPRTPPAPNSHNIG